MPRVINIVKKGLYRDSVYLLHIGEELRKVSGVIAVSYTHLTLPTNREV